MTTAHRPTWKAAYGLNDSVNKGYVPTRAYSARVKWFLCLGHAWILESQIEETWSRQCCRTQIKRFQSRTASTRARNKT